MVGALGSGTSGFPVHGVPKTRPEKSAFLAGSGAPSGTQNRAKKVRKTNQGPPRRYGGEKGRKRSVNEGRRMDKIGFSYERGCENQEACVFEIHEKNSEKEWSNGQGSHENVMQKLFRTCASNRL